MATGGDKPPSLDADVDMADLASLDAPAASSAAAAGAPSTRFRPRAKGKPKPKPEAPKPEPLAVPKSEPEPDPEPEPVSKPEPVAAPAPPPEDDRLNAMEVDGAGDAAGPGDGAAAEEDFVVREIDVYFTPKPFDDDTKVMSSPHFVIDDRLENVIAPTIMTCVPATFRVLSLNHCLYIFLNWLSTGLVPEIL